MLLIHWFPLVEFLFGGLNAFGTFKAIKTVIQKRLAVANDASVSEKLQLRYGWRSTLSPLAGQNGDSSR
jgi:hypothetical protein